MKKKAFVLTIIFGISTAIQAVANIIITRTIGVTLEYDQFLLSVALPSVVVTVLYGTINDSLMPFLKSSNRHPKEQLSEILGSLFLFGFFISLVFTSIDIILGRSMQYALVLNLAYPFTIVAVSLGTLNYASNKFYLFPIIQVLGSIFNLAFVVLLFPYLGIWSLIISFVLSVIVQMLFMYQRGLSLRFGSLAPFFKLFLPLVFGIFFVKGDSLLVRHFAQFMDTGSQVYLNIIYKFVTLASGLLTIGLQTVILPKILDLMKDEKHKEVKEMVLKAKIVSIAFSLGLSIIVYFLTPILVKYLYVGGRFTNQNYLVSISYIPYFVFPGILLPLVGVFLQPLYALKKHLLVGIFSVFSFFLAAYLGSLFQQTSAILSISVSLSTLFLLIILFSQIVWQKTYEA